MVKINFNKEFVLKLIAQDSERLENIGINSQIIFTFLNNEQFKEFRNYFKNYIEILNKKYSNLQIIQVLIHIYKREDFEFSKN